MDWEISIFEVWEDQRGTCPICGRYIMLSVKDVEDHLVGHHIIPKSRGGDDSKLNCEARHCRCSMWAERSCRDGNPTKEEIKLYRLQNGGTNSKVV